MRDRMISEKEAEDALTFLRKSAKGIEDMWRIAREAEASAENKEALLVKEFHLNGIPATLAKSYARADDRWLEIKEFEAKAFAALKGIEARREAAKIAISLYQSEVKDRI